MKPLPADDYDIPQTKNNTDSTSNVVELNPDKTKLNSLKPATRVELGKNYGVSSAAIGKWLKQIRQIWEPRSEAADLTTPDNLVSEWGQHQIAEFQKLGAGAYEYEVLRNNPIHSLTRFSSNFEEPEEIQLLDVEDQEFQQGDAISQALQSLEAEAQQGLNRAGAYHGQSQLRLQRSRRLKQNLLVRQGQADALQDLALYQKAYDSALAQGLAAQLEEEGDDERQ